jgi:iron(III) transport system substrate-binding protein
MRFPRPATALLTTVVCALGITGCGLDAGSQETETLTIYTSRPAEISEEVVEKFEEQHPEYDVQLLRVGAQEVADRVRAESGSPQADIWWGGTSQQFDQGVSEDLLDPLPASVLDRVPEEFHGKDGLWVGEQQLAQIIAYNHDMLDEAEAPQDWDDLVDPRYQDEILLRDVAASGTMRAVFSSLVDRTYEETGTPEQGYEFLRKLDANTKDYAANPQDLYLRVQRQEAPITIWNLQDILTQADGGAPFTPVMPASGAPVLVDGVGKVKGAPHAEGADVFLDYLLSEETQTTLANEHFQLPTIELDQEPEWLEPLDMHEMTVDWETVSDQDSEWIGYWIQNIKNQG